MVFITPDNLFDTLKAMNAFQFLYRHYALAALVLSMECTLGIGRGDPDKTLSSEFSLAELVFTVKLVVPVSVFSLITTTLFCLNSPVTCYHKM